MQPTAVEELGVVGPAGFEPATYWSQTSDRRVCQTAASPAGCAIYPPPRGPKSGIAGSQCFARSHTKFRCCRPLSSKFGVASPVRCSPCWFSSRSVVRGELATAGGAAGSGVGEARRSAAGGATVRPNCPAGHRDASDGRVSSPGRGRQDAGELQRNTPSRRAARMPQVRRSRQATARSHPMPITQQQGSQGLSHDCQ